MRALQEIQDKKDALKAKEEEKEEESQARKLEFKQMEVNMRNFHKSINNDQTKLLEGKIDGAVKKGDEELDNTFDKGVKAGVDFQKGVAAAARAKVRRRPLRRPLKASPRATAQPAQAAADEYLTLAHRAPAARARVHSQRFGGTKVKAMTANIEGNAENEDGQTEGPTLPRRSGLRSARSQVHLAPLCAPHTTPHAPHPPL